MFVPVICLFLILMNGAYGSGFGRCPKYPSMKNFNFTQLFEGQWYGAAKTYSLTDFSSDCSGLMFIIIDKYVIDLDMVLVKISTGKPTFYSGHLMRTSFKPTGSEVYFKIENKYKGEYQVLDTDYTNFIVLWSCNSWGWLAHFDQIWVIGKQRHLSDEIHKKVTASLKKFGLDPGRLVLTSKKCNSGFLDLRR